MLKTPISEPKQLDESHDYVTFYNDSTCDSIRDNYRFFSNLISLAVGPFRGKMGTLRPCDDLMVSDRFNFFANGSEGTLIGEPKDNSNVIGGWKKGTEDNKDYT